MDTSAIPDGAPDVFTSDPDGYTGAGTAGATGNWRNVISLRVNLLARNTEKSPGYTDTKLYTLGQNADGSANTCSPGTSTLCSSVSYKRHAFTAQVRMTNPADRAVTP